MTLTRIFPALAWLVAGSLFAAQPHSDVRIASPWPAQNTIITMLGYGDNIVGTSMIAKTIPLFRQSLPHIENVAVVSVNSGHELAGADHLARYATAVCAEIDDGAEGVAAPAGRGARTGV